MKEQLLFKSTPLEKFDLLTKDEVVELARGYEDLLDQMQNKYKKLEEKLLAGEQTSFLLGEQLLNIKSKLFGKSSEKSPQKSHEKEKKRSSKKRVRLPSERYPNLDIIEKEVTLDQMPVCPCCSAEMSDSGMTEDSDLPLV